MNFKDSDIGRFLTAFPGLMYTLMHDYDPPESLIKLNKSEIRTMVILHINLGNNPSQISQKLNMEKGSFSSVIGNLIKKGLIEKIRDHEDKRKFQLVMTKEGQSLINDHMQSLVKHLEKKLAVLTDEEYRRMTYAFKEIHTIHEIIAQRN